LPYLGSQPGGRNLSTASGVKFSFGGGPCSPVIPDYAYGTKKFQKKFQDFGTFRSYSH